VCVRPYSNTRPVALNQYRLRTALCVVAFAAAERCRLTVSLQAPVSEATAMQ
jgi:hypothetical protein